MSAILSYLSKHPEMAGGLDDPLQVVDCYFCWHHTAEGMSEISLDPDRPHEQLIPVCPLCREVVAGLPLLERLRLATWMHGTATGAEVA